MNTFIANTTQRRVGTVLSAALVLMVAHWASPAAAGGGSISGGGIELRQGTSNLYSSHSVEMEKISGMAQATLPTIGFETVDGMLGDGDEVYLNTGQLAGLRTQHRSGRL